MGAFTAVLRVLSKSLRFCLFLYRARFLRHLCGAYAARAAGGSWSARMAAGGLNPWRSISQVAL